MIRNKETIIKNNKTDIIFQIIDWKSNDIYKKKEDDDDENEENDEEQENSYKNKVKRLSIRGYGVTDNGNSISVHINGFQPYFYIRIPQDWDSKVFNLLKNQILKDVPEYVREGLHVAKIVQRKEFYGFTNNKLFNFGYFEFKNQGCYYSFLKILREKKIFIRRFEQEFDFSNKIYETKVSPILRFFHNRNINPSGWCKVKEKDYSIKHDKITRCQIEIEFDYSKINKYDKKDVAKILVASFDIECTSCDGSFPKFSRPSDEIIQIGTTIYEYGTDKCVYQYICTLKNSDDIDGVDLECYDSERELLIGWSKFIEKLDPDIMTGYNIWGFDWEYIYERAKITNCLTQLFRRLSRIKLSEKTLKKNELTVQDLSSSALGQNILKYIDIEGIIQIDLLKVVQRDYKLDSYKLDNVSKTFMKNQKVDLTPAQLFANYKKGTPDKIKEIAVYCIKDCILVNDLINKLQVITNNLGMSNVCIVPFSFLFTRGQGIKIFSLVAKFCNDENFIIKDLTPDDIDKNSYEGAIVFVPTPGVYFEPVVVMDYNSLYPSSMIAENISHDSMLGFKEYRLKESTSKSSKTNKTNNEKDDYELVNDTIKEEYMNIEGYHYIDIEYDIFQGLDDDKRKVGYKMCRFAEPDNGDKSVLPRILRKLLKARKDTRKVMKYQTLYLKDGTKYEGLLDEKDDNYEINNLELGVKNYNKNDVDKIEKTNNDFQIAVLDGLQLAYKVTCNSLYGQVGATTSPICFKELAACTTATGRRMVTVARDLTLAKFEGSKLTYGDSVASYTPIYIKHNNIIELIEINQLSNKFKGNWLNCTEQGKETKEYFELNNVETWSDKGWTKLYRIIRHKLHKSKKMYRINSPLGIVDVTDDHSLLDHNGIEISPKDIKKDTKLLYNFMNDNIHNKYDIQKDLSFNDQLNAAINFQKLYKDCNNKNIQYINNKYIITDTTSNNIEINEIEDYNDYVYDLTTENHHFAAGIGNMIVHNTDSVFINFTGTIKHRNPGKDLTEKDLLAESIKIGEEAAEHINSHMKAPQNIEYEKTFWPFCIFSKKRYFGNKYEFDLDKYKQTSMGIVLKRRDNAPIVKTIYGGVIDIILNKRNVEDSKKYFNKAVKDLLAGNVDISQLVISKTVKTDYSNPTLIAHKVLADRMGERDPGNKPQSNDRIPYCYIDPKNLKCKICNVKVNPDKCKCVTCMNVYCFYHLNNHRQSCKKICRFCRIEDDGENLKKCNTCFGQYCKQCFDKHNLRTDKYKVKHNDKCKKPLSNKLLQGDTIENPQYIKDNKLIIDYNYYLTNQIQKPVFQIFELVMDKPEKIIEDIVRDEKNKKSGNANIKDWFKAMNKNNIEEEKQNNEKYSLKKEVKNNNEDDDLNMLSDDFEVEEIKDLDYIDET